MRVLLVVNPTASAFTAHHRHAVEKILGDGNEVTIADTTERGHARELAEQAQVDGIDVVVVLAGDGTLNEAANGLVGTSTALGVLPGGSTNVFARTIGMGRRPAAAAELLRVAMAGGTKRRIGLGVANGRHFLFHVGVGFDAAVVRQVEHLEERLPLKRTIGQLSFAASAVNTWLCRYARSQPSFTVRVPRGNGGDESMEGVFAICLNTNPYTYVGPRPLDVDPTATLDSPLSLAVFANVDLSTLGAVFASSLAGRPLENLSAVTIRSALRSVTVEGQVPFPWQVDGDLAGEGSSLSLSYEPTCLDLFVPGPESNQ